MSDTEVDKSGAAVRFPPPAAAALTIVVGYVIGRFVPLLAAYDLATPSRYYIGATIIVVAVAVLALWPIRYFKETGQNVTPWSETPEIIVQGPFKFTRNPMYLMMLIVCVGFAIVFSEIWILILTPVLALALYHIAIKHEEVYLEEKFGESYRTYKNTVRRWI
jgi:protein-S-isoprenylcysteine O-methyltransferase Ste14